MALPAHLSSGLVKGYFGRWVIDGLDDDRDPDIINEGGISITFTAEVYPSTPIPVIKYPQANPPASYLADPITVSTNADGVIVDPFDMVGIRLMSNEQPGSVPPVWVWRAVVKKGGATIANTTFSVPVNGEVDISSVIPVVEGNPLPAWWTALSTLEQYVRELPTGGGGGGGGSVASVNGKIGTVVLTAADVNARPATWVPTIDNVQLLSAKLATFVTAAQVADLAPKPQGTRAVLATDGNGAITNLSYSQLASAGALAQRTSTGHIESPVPLTAVQLANKGYVDGRSYESGAYGAGLVLAKTRLEARTKLGIYVLEQPSDPIPVGAPADSIILRKAANA